MAITKFRFQQNWAAADKGTVYITRVLGGDEIEATLTVQAYSPILDEWFPVLVAGSLFEMDVLSLPSKTRIPVGPEIYGLYPCLCSKSETYYIFDVEFTHTNPMALDAIDVKMVPDSPYLNPGDLVFTKEII